MSESNWQYKKSKAKRDYESLTMLRDILNAQNIKAKRLEVTKRNPMFYLMFHDGMAQKEVSDGLSQ